MSIDELRKALSAQNLRTLKTPAQVEPRPGCPTGFGPLDQFLLWKGFPKGALSLISGPPGLGGTRLWLQAAGLLTQQNRWAAWMNGAETELFSGSLRAINLQKLLWIAAPVDLKQRLWALQELLSLCLFDIIGCDFENALLRDYQILKLKKLAARYQVALVVISRVQRSHPFFSLAMELNRNHISVVRALHRPTPHLIERRELYADTMPLLAAGRAALGGRALLTF